MSIYNPNFLIKSSFLGLAVSILLASCDPKKTDPPYPVPTTYSFENVNYSGQTARQEMLEELVDYIETANTTGVALDVQKLKNMYANANNPFSNAALNAPSKQLKNKTFLTTQGVIEDYLQEVAAASQSTTAGSNGVAGVVTSNNGSKKYLLSANGIDYAEVIEKLIMGATFYYQATGVYLSEDKIGEGVNNVTVTPGEGTAMEHHWDEAFGYLGVPKDFPANTSNLSFWGKYVDRRNAQLGSSAKIMDAFLKGRAAISNKDMKAKNEAIQVIRDEWEKVSAATAISYLNQAKTNISDDAVRNHVLSEAIGFVSALKYNPTKKITDAQIEQVLGYIGTNLYDVSAQNLDQARNLLASVYGLNDKKDSL